jgi:hypothetical protein
LKGEANGLITHVAFFFISNSNQKRVTNKPSTRDGNESGLGRVEQKTVCNSTHEALPKPTRDCTYRCNSKPAQTHRVSDGFLLNVQFKQ